MPFDCNDNNASINHSAVDIRASGVDENCDGLETCYVDSDADTFRTSATVSSTDTACTSSGHALASAALDCCDSDANARPTQTLYYSTVDACGSYDYNCSGTAERQLSTISSGSCTDDGTDTGTCASTPSSGWIGSVPACGSSGMRSGGCTTAPDCDCYPCTTGAGCLLGRNCVARAATTATQNCH
jgi:hypothetical protein